MKKSAVVIVVTLLLSVNALAQTAEGMSEEQSRMMEIIYSSASGMKSLKCDFVQTKELSILQDKLVSTGKMLYCQDGGKLQWKYLTPNEYMFVINGSRVMMQSNGKTDVIETSQNRMFQGIANIIMSSLTGQCLTATSDFQVDLLVENGEWIADLKPKRKEIKKMFNEIRLHFDASMNAVSCIEMIEKKGDKTIIEFKDIQINVPVDVEAFEMATN